MRKHELIQSTSNDLKKISQSSDTLNMHSLRAAHTNRFEWVECLHNVSMIDPSAHGYVLKDNMFVPKFHHSLQIDIEIIKNREIWFFDLYLGGWEGGRGFTGVLNYLNT